MDVLSSLFLGLALMMSCCCGSHEEESTSEFGETTTADYNYNYDYDYNATFDYVYVTAIPNLESVRDKAAGIGPVSLLLLLGLAVHQVWNR